MNEKTARQIAEMKTPDDRGQGGDEQHHPAEGREGCGHLLWHRQIFENTAGRNGYSAWSAWDSQGREWKFQKDVSIAGPDEQKCELVTPILTYGDIETLQELCRPPQRRRSKKRRHQGLRSPHPHRGARPHAAEPTEPRQHHGEPREPDRRSAEAGPQPHEPLLPHGTTRILEQVNRRKPRTMTQLADIWYTSNGANYGRDHHYNDSRYHMLNLHATFTKGTLSSGSSSSMSRAAERRGGIHAGLKSYIQLCLALSQMAKDVRTASPKPQQNENPKYAMRTWLLRLGFIGEEFATARDFLTRNLSGDTAFRHGRAAA